MSKEKRGRKGREGKRECMHAGRKERRKEKEERMEEREGGRKEGREDGRKPIKGGTEGGRQGVREEEGRKEKKDRYTAKNTGNIKPTVIMNTYLLTITFFFFIILNFML